MGDRSSKAAYGCESLTDVQGGLEPLSLCNIAGDLGCADDFSMLIFYGRDGQRDINALAVLAHADGLEMIDSFSCPYFCQNSRLILVQFRRDNGCDRLPDNLFSLVAEDAFRALVPTRYDSV